ncbi:MAG: response regulator [Planctomycetota bacterium]|nr:response regulator [Planctomycetota bacterium]
MPDTSPPKKILIVDQSADTRRLTARLLASDGYEVKTAGSREEALRLCKNVNFDLLISGLRLPDGDGLELAREIAASCQIKSIAYTGFIDDVKLNKALAAGFDAHLIKPTQIPVLLETIKKVLAEEQA